MSKQTTKEFAAIRLKEIAIEIKALRDESDLLRGILSKMSETPNRSRFGAATATQSRPSRRSRAGESTFKEMILSVLKSQPSGANANEILLLIEREFGKKIQRSSLSPQLSRLMRDGGLKREGKNWILAEDSEFNSKMKEAPEGASDLI